MRKIGAQVSTAGGLLKAIDNIEALGGNCLQIFAGSPRIWNRSSFSEADSVLFKEITVIKDLYPVFIHAPYLINLASSNPELIQKSTTVLISDLNNGKKIDSSGVIVHLGSHQGRSFDSVKIQITSLINQIFDETETTPLVIENSAGQNGKIGNLNEMKYLFDHIDSQRLKLCLDTAHLYAAGFDINNPRVIDTLAIELDDLCLLDKLVCIHLNGSKAGLGSGRDLHENLYEGTINSSGLACFINHSGFKKIPLILEVPGDDGRGPDKINLDYARNLI